MFVNLTRYKFYFWLSVKGGRNLALLQAEALACVLGLANVPNREWTIILFSFCSKIFIAVVCISGLLVTFPRYVFVREIKASNSDYQNKNTQNSRSCNQNLYPNEIYRVLATGPVSFKYVQVIFKNIHPAPLPSSYLF